MSDGYETLRSIGAQKIHEKTHIAKVHVQAIMHESFDDMSKIQFLGFLSILEREYDVNLDDIREKGLIYFKNTLNKEEELNDVFVTAKKKKNYSIFYMGIALLIFIIVAAYTVSNFTSSDSMESGSLDNTAIENAQKNIQAFDDINDSEVDENVTEEPAAVRSFKIIPKSEIWVGYIDLNTYQKYQKLFTDELSIDPEKDWLLHLGHGYVTMEINGEVKEFNNKLNMRFAYQNGELRKISFSEFKNLNRGNKW